MAAQQTYRLFEVALKERRVLSPSLHRLVLTGADVARMKTEGPDQRIKVFFPLPGQDAPEVPSGDDWYARYRELADDQRPPMRTYTLRQLRAAQGEVDVDFVLHGETGPASRWAVHAQPGDRVTLLAPDADCAETSQGWEWKPPAGIGQVLLVADETALPAVAGILEELAAQVAPPRVLALLEVADEGHAIALKAPPSAELVWLPRGQAAYGQALVEAVQARLGRDRRGRADPLGAVRCRRGRAVLRLGRRRGGCSDGDPPPSGPRLRAGPACADLHGLLAAGQGAGLNLHDWRP